MGTKHIHLARLKADKVYRVVATALEETLRHHGPIEEKHIPSATKRIAGQIKALIHNLTQEEK